MMMLTVEYYFTHPQDKLGMYASDPEDNSHEHSHEFAELVIVEEGHGLHVINGRPLYIQQGDVFTFSLATFIIMMSWGRLS